MQADYIFPRSLLSSIFGHRRAIPPPPIEMTTNGGIGLIAVILLFFHPTITNAATSTCCDPGQETIDGSCHDCPVGRAAEKDKINGECAESCL